MLRCRNCKGLARQQRLTQQLLWTVGLQVSNLLQMHLGLSLRSIEGRLVHRHGQLRHAPPAARLREG